MKILKNISLLLLFLSTAAQAQDFSNLRQFTENGKIGFKDSLGNVIVEPKYQGVGFSFDGLKLVLRNGKYGYINSLGIEVVEAVYDNFGGRLFYEEPYPYLKAEINGKYGVINIHNGNVLIPLKYERIDSIGSNFYAAKKDGLYGVVSLSGAELTPFIYSSMGRFSDDVIPVEIGNKKWGVIDTTNHTIIEPSKKFKYIYAFRNGLSVFNSDKGKKGVINKKSEIIIPAIYDEVDINTKISRVIVKQGDKVGVISYESRIIIPFIYNSIGLLQNCRGWGGMAECSDLNEGVSILEVDGHKCVSSNYFLAEKDEKKTMFNANGKIIIEGMDEIKSFCNFKFIEVANNGHLGLYDSLGNNIIPVIDNNNNYYRIVRDYGIMQYNDIGVIIKNNNNKRFIVFADNTYTRTKEYDKIETIESRKNKNGSYVIGFIVEDNKKKGVIDRNGKIIIPVKYDYIKAEKDKSGKITGYTLHLDDKETFYKLP